MPYVFNDLPDQEDEIMSMMMPQRAASIDDPPEPINQQFGYEDMIEEPQPELPVLNPPKRPGFFSKLRAAAPSMIDAGLIAVGTPNIAYGGPTDIARAVFGGMRGAEAIRTNRDAYAADQARRDAQAEAMLALRQRQTEAAEAQRERAARRERYVNVGGAVFDTETKQYLNPKEAQIARDFDRWRKQANEMGLKPGSPEYQHYASTGKLPDWYGKPEPPQRTTGQPKSMVTVPADFAKKHFIYVPDGQPTVQIPEATYNNILKDERDAKKPTRQPGALTESQRIQQETKRRETFAKIEKDKTDRLLKAEEDFAEGKIGEPELARRKRAAQTAYESAIRAAGGAVAPPPRIRVKIKATGKTGTIDASEFNEATMERM